VRTLVAKVVGAQARYSSTASSGASSDLLGRQRVEMYASIGYTHAIIIIIILLFHGIETDTDVSIRGDMHAIKTKSSSLSLPK
jgi:hypothetical protein